MTETRPALDLLHDLLATAHAHIAAACDPTRDRADEAAFRHHCEAAQLAGMAAYLLDALDRQPGWVADGVAAAVHELAEDGEPLAEWVAEQVTARGVKVLTEPTEPPAPAEDWCPYQLEGLSHPLSWCGYDTCRES